VTKAQKLVQQLTSEVEEGRLDWRDALVQLAEGLKPRRRSKQKRQAELPVPAEGLNVWRDDLLDVVKSASRATTTTFPTRTGWGGWGNMGTTPAPPIFRTLLLEGDEGQLRVSATRREFGIRQQVKARGSLPPVCPEAAVLKSVLRRLPKHAVINLHRDGDMLRVECSDVVSAIETHPAEEFPAVGDESPEVEVDFPTAELREAIDAVAPAASADEARPILTGVLFRLREGALDLVATDTHRLARVTLAARVHEGDDCIVPVKALNLWTGITAKRAEGDGTRLVIGKEHVFLHNRGTTVWAKPIDGVFPNCEKVVPSAENMQCRITFNRKHMLDAIDQLTPIAAEASGRIVFELNNAALHLVTSSRQAGSAEAQVPAHWTGEAEPFALNYRFLARGLEMLQGEEVTLEYQEPLKAFALREEDRQYLLMPMQVL